MEIELLSKKSVSFAGHFLPYLNQTMKVRIITVILLTCLNALSIKAQDTWQYIKTRHLSIRQSPDPNGKVLAKRSLGDSVKVTGFDEKQFTLTIDGYQREGEFLKIDYEGKPAYVFSGGISMIKPFSLNRMQEFAAMYGSSFDIKEAEKLIQDSVVVFRGLYLEVRGQNGNKVKIEEQGNGFDYFRLSRSASGFLEVITNAVAFDLPTYVRLKDARKFDFPLNSPCMYASVSPSGKYVAGVLMGEENQIAVFDFATAKLLRKAPLKGISSIIPTFTWKGDAELTLTNPDDKTFRKTLLIPQLQLKNPASH